MVENTAAITDEDVLSYHAGLDLGKLSDYTALAVIGELPGEEGKPIMHLLHLERYPLGTPYSDIIGHVHQLLEDPALTLHRQRTNKWNDQVWTETEYPSLTVDATGVGVAVAELLAREKLPGEFYPVTLTGGEKQTYSAGAWRVPKRVLLSEFEASAHAGDLAIAGGMELADRMIEELRNFKRETILTTGHVTYESWRESDHDDLIFAAALACWAAQKRAWRRWRPFLTGAFRGY